MENLERYLLEAAGRKKEDIALDNPYREIGFDGGQPRLGWVAPMDFNQIRKEIVSLREILQNKDSFIFIGMGGSVNAIKPLINIFGPGKIFTLDSLDPRAINDILSQIQDLRKTLVVAISKSGTTKETQLLAGSLRNYYSKKTGVKSWYNNFLWLADPEAFLKLDNLGWDKVKKVTIQANRRSDIGGRFSAPQTQIFLLPLYLFLNKDIDKLEKVYQAFVEAQSGIAERALQDALGVGDGNNFYFSPFFDPSWEQGFASWVAQLFQESLGGKDSQRAVKTIVNSEEADFIKLDFSPDFDQPELVLMGKMYYYQMFVAYLAALWSVNFVNQEFVEKYKKKMQALEAEEVEVESFLTGELDVLIQEVKRKITKQQRFIEIVLYFFPDSEIVNRLHERFLKEFGEKTILIFIGSDWNHQSYQSAFGNKDTFYLLLCLSKYHRSDCILEKDRLNNIETLRRIALATHQTLSKKSLLYDLAGV